MSYHWCYSEFSSSFQLPGAPVYPGFFCFVTDFFLFCGHPGGQLFFSSLRVSIKNKLFPDERFSEEADIVVK